LSWGSRVGLAVVVGLCAWEVAYPQVPTQANTETKRVAAAAAQYEITGIVVSGTDGGPVAHCRLSPTLVVQGGSGGRQFPSSIGSFEADEHGRFSISVPSAGLWSLSASARGFVTQQYEAHQAFFSAIVLTTERPKMDIRFQLSPEASVTGVVLDEAGEPVRAAQVSLQLVPPARAGGPEPVGGIRGTTRTDDRGIYEITNLASGSYRLMVQAQPWYAAAAQPRRISTSEPQPVDPSLDFAYPLTWFPGVDDAAMAETIVLHAGDSRQADFHLVPMPSVHVRIVPPRTGGSPERALPIVQQIGAGGAPNFVQVSMHVDAQGQIDVGGMTPGLYQIRLGGPNQDERTTLVEVAANSTRMVDLNSPANDMARVTIHLDGLADSGSGYGPGRGGSIQVNLIDVDTHRGNFLSNDNGTMGFTNGRRGQRDAGADRVVEVPPGRYEVALQGRPNIYLTGLAAKGAEVAGRYVILSAGDSALTVHAASGRARLSGVATRDSKALDGAMVLLVPVTIEDSNSITFLRQDQTNTDGSFEIANIIPGQYILVAIEDGWQINWGDRSTLRKYLPQGVPVELKSSAVVKQNVVAQAP
jgi:hypothetical protein